MTMAHSNAQLGDWCQTLLLRATRDAQLHSVLAPGSSTYFQVRLRHLPLRATAQLHAPRRPRYGAFNTSLLGNMTESSAHMSTEAPMGAHASTDECAFCFSGKYSSTAGSDM